MLQKHLLNTFLILLVMKCMLFLNFEFPKIACQLPQKFWTIYKLHFALSDSLRVILLQADSNANQLRHFTDIILRQMYTENHINVTIQITEKTLFRSTKTKNRVSYVVPSDQNIINFQHFKHLNIQQFIKIKKLSNEFSYGLLILVWNEETLENFLDQDYKVLIPNPRSPYMIIFGFTKQKKCSFVKENISGILVRLWQQYNVLNVIALTSCSCKSDVVYTYWPFARNKKSWGQFHNFTFDEIASNPSLILNSLWNLNYYPLKVSIFNRIPTALNHIPIPLQNSPNYKNLKYSIGFGGIDGSLLAGIAEYLHFNAVSVIKPNSGYGKILLNGTATESLGLIITGQAQISANGRFLMDYGTDDIEFTWPHSRDSICAVVPKSKKIPQWKKLFRAFHCSTWLVMFNILGICLLFGFFFKINVWKVYRISMGISIKDHVPVKHFLFLGSCMFYYVIINGIYQGSLFTSVSTVLYYKDIDTLEALDFSGLIIDSGLSVLNYDNQSDLIKRLRKKQITTDYDPLKAIIDGRQIATLERKNDLNIYVVLQASNGKIPLHIVNECITSYFLAFIVPKGSPFLRLFNHVIIRFIESGLPSKWYQDVVDSLILENLFTLKDDERFKAFTFQDVQTAFYILFFGLFIGFVLFLKEYFIVE